MYSYKRLTNKKIIRKILTNPEIWDRICEDGQDSKHYNPPMNKNCHWVGLYHNNILLGIGWLHPHNSVTAVCHVNVLKEHRIHSLGAGMMAISYVVTETDYTKFIAEVGEIHKDVLGFMNKIGFEREGVNKASLLKNNKLVDQIYFGSNRNTLSKVIKLWQQQQ